MMNTVSTVEDYFNPQNQVYIDRKSKFTGFLEQTGDYASKVVKLVENNQTRLIVDLDDLRHDHTIETNEFLKTPLGFFAPWQDALNTFAKHQANIETDTNDLTIGIEGNFGGNLVSPRDLTTKYLGQLVCVEGIATRTSIVRPKTSKKVLFAPATGQHFPKTFYDKTSLTGFQTPAVIPNKDADGNVLEEEFGLSHYINSQSLSIQEMPENSPSGLIPSSVGVVLTDDLVDKLKPGDRVRIVGVYRALGRKEGDQASGFFKTILVGNNVIHIGNQGHGGSVKLTDKDVNNIRKISKRPDVFNLLSRSIAPSIHGHDYIKQALVLLLLGGVEKNLQNGTHLRGDINLLMVGDPSTAKSQLLRFVLNVAELAIPTTGRGSSGAGLTAAVVQDKDTGERRLEAGAMVLADRGIVCIDEFDKMSDMDRVAIHEVMEQQTVTIAKAGIHMSLNARCSVVAAANPIYGQYDTNLSPHKNVALPDSLVSRFDLLFIVLDSPTPERDRKISEKVIANHCYVGKVGQADYDDKGKDETVYQKFDRFLHSSLKSKRGGRGGGQVDILSIPFLKKYIHFAKEMTKPTLTDEASKNIATAYCRIRNNEDRRGESMPITVRSLETLIRLATAHAKSHLRKRVVKKDVDAAVEILKSALLASTDAEVKKQSNKQNKQNEKKKDNDDDDNDDLDLGTLDSSGTTSSQASSSSGSSTRKSPRRNRRGAPTDGTPAKKQKTSQDGQSRTKFFQSAMVKYMNEYSLYSTPFDKLVEAVNSQLSGKDTAFEAGEVRSILQDLEKNNLVMFRNQVVHRI